MLRLCHGVYENGRMNYDKWSVDGQSTTTLNWVTLVTYETRESCVDWIKLYKEEIEDITALDEHGYGTRELCNKPITL